MGPARAGGDDQVLDVNLSPRPDPPRGPVPTIPNILFRAADSSVANADR